jgi:hypothetical protein
MQSLLLLDLHPCILQIRDPNILVVGDELLRRELHLVIEELVQLRALGAQRDECLPHREVGLGKLLSYRLERRC